METVSSPCGSRPVLVFGNSAFLASGEPGIADREAGASGAVVCEGVGGRRSPRAGPSRAAMDRGQQARAPELAPAAAPGWGPDPRPLDPSTPAELESRLALPSPTPVLPVPGRLPFQTLPEVSIDPGGPA